MTPSAGDLPTRIHANVKPAVFESAFMSEDRDKVDQILEDLDIQSGSTEPASDSGKEAETETGAQDTTEDRLPRLHEAGAITDEEYDVLQSHLSEDDTSYSPPADSVEFGKPIATSEGADMDFSIVGVFEDIDTSKLTNPPIANAYFINEADMPTTEKGGPGRTLVCWQIYNHSNDEVRLKHRDIEFIGQNQIAYNLDDNPLIRDHFGPGWRTENWADITADTRIRYVSTIKIPYRLAEVKIDTRYAGSHHFKITNDMFFPHSELPVKIDL